MNRLKRISKALLLGGALFALFTFGLRWRTHRAAAENVYRNVAAVPATHEEPPPPAVAIVFGAGLWRNGGGPSPVLYDRVASAAELYRAGRVRKLLLTGDNRFRNYNEPAVMRDTAIGLGVPAADLVLDYAGRRTYDSCYRARHIFGVTRAVLVTQRFHLDRALYLCHALGVESVGLAADRRAYPRGARLWWQAREIPATLSAWGDLNLWRPTPVLGEKIPIAKLRNPG
ncbi:MAG: SanA/YdcF family protein [Pyrinomonadaceae bacterium]